MKIFIMSVMIPLILIGCGDGNSERIIESTHNVDRLTTMENIVLITAAAERSKGSRCDPIDSEQSFITTIMPLLSERKDSKLADINIDEVHYIPLETHYKIYFITSFICPGNVARSVAKVVDGNIYWKDNYAMPDQTINDINWDNVTFFIGDLTLDETGQRRKHQDQLRFPSCEEN